MKPIKIIKEGGKGIRKTNRGGEYYQSGFMHMWKCYNEILLLLYKIKIFVEAKKVKMWMLKFFINLV
jgi:hypothetical protein